jgi:hypothetical protein
MVAKGNLLNSPFQRVNQIGKKNANFLLLMLIYSINTIYLFLK